MFVRVSSILYKTLKEQNKNTKTPLHFESLWGYTLEELKKQEITILPNEAYVYQDEIENFHVESKTDTLLDGYDNKENIYIWIQNNQTIFNCNEFEYTFIGKAQNLISSIKEYQEGFLANRINLETKIYSKQTEKYYIGIKKNTKKDGYTIIVKQKKKDPKGKQYHVFAKDIVTLMKQVSTCVLKYLESLTKDVTILEKEHKRDHLELLEKEYIDSEKEL